MVEAQLFIGAAADKPVLESEDAFMHRFFKSTDIEAVVKQLEIYIKAENLNEHEPVVIRARLIPAFS
jgi:hypothetical protein